MGTNSLGQKNVVKHEEREREQEMKYFVLK